MTSLPVSIGIAGIGNVGSEVVSQLIKHKEYKKSYRAGPNFGFCLF